MTQNAYNKPQGGKGQQVFATSRTHKAAPFGTFFEACAFGTDSNSTNAQKTDKMNSHLTIGHSNRLTLDH